MIQSGLKPVRPHHKDDSFLHSFGATTVDPKGLPENFSVYDGRAIPNQNKEDTRFTPSIPPLFFGCTGETTSFACSIEDKKLYSPLFTYRNTKPFDNGGRDIRDALQTTIDLGLQDEHKVIGGRRTRYGHVYAAGKIDDFDAQRIALMVNQKAISVGTYWYAEFTETTTPYLPMPNFKNGSLHNYAITGWATFDGVPYLEVIPWLGKEWAYEGKGYMSRELFNKLINQPNTGAFVLYKPSDYGPVPLGYQVYVDMVVAFLLNLFSR